MTLGASPMMHDQATIRISCDVSQSASIKDGQKDRRFDVTPNVNLPYDYMTPRAAQAYIFEGRLMFCMIGVFACDAFASLTEEWQIIMKKRVSVPVISHYISRLSTLLFIITCTIYLAVELSRCDILQDIMGVSFITAITSTSFTFLLRIRAIFNNSIAIMVSFGVLWLSIVSTSILILTATTSGYIGSTRYCNLIFYRLSSSPVWALIAWTVFDTLSFIAMSWKLVTATRIKDQTSSDAPWWKRAKNVITGESLPNFTRSLLRGGEKYFLSSLGFDILVLAIALGPSIRSVDPSDSGLALIFCDLVIKNVLACQLFRQTYLSVALIQRQRISLMNQDPACVEHDILLSENLAKRGLGSSILESVDDIRIPDLATSLNR